MRKQKFTVIWKDADDNMRVSTYWGTSEDDVYNQWETWSEEMDDIVGDCHWVGCMLTKEFRACL
jgi:hypothetical protein